MAAEGRIGLAVTGTHGKSTTTALLGHLLEAAGMDPTVEVGAFIPAWGATVRLGGGAPFLVEADEFGDNFLNYHPAGAIVTNVEMDHPDYFADREAVLASMERFVRGMGEDPRLGGRLLLTTAADRGSQALLERLGGWEGRDPAVWARRRDRGAGRGLRGRGSDLHAIRTGVRIATGGGAQRPERDRGAGHGPRARSAARGPGRRAADLPREPDDAWS